MTMVMNLSSLTGGPTNLASVGRRSGVPAVAQIHPLKPCLSKLGSLVHHLCVIVRGSRNSQSERIHKVQIYLNIRLHNLPVRDLMIADPDRILIRTCFFCSSRLLDNSPEIFDRVWNVLSFHNACAAEPTALRPRICTLCPWVDLPSDLVRQSPAIESVEDICVFWTSK